MLKSVFFDEKEHAHLIEFLNSYRDENDNNNISSAIRFLMQKGYEYLYGKSPVQVPYAKKKINTDDMKKEIMNEVLSEINNRLLDKLTNTFSQPNQPIQPILMPMPYMTGQNIPNIAQNIYPNVSNNQPINPSTNQVTDKATITEKPEIKKESSKLAKNSFKKSNGSSLLSNLLSNVSR